MATTCGELIRSIDWSQTALGPEASWPIALRALVADLLHTRQPMLLFWGPELVQLYNDAFVPSFGRGKHPAAMGQRAAECWADAWPVVGAQIDAVLRAGEPAWHEDALVPIERNGRMEEVFWTYSYSPAFDDGGRIAGVLVIVTEVTGRVISARRLASLSALGAALAAATSHDEVLDRLAPVVAANPQDLPFVVVSVAGEVRRALGVDAAAARRTIGADLLAPPIAAGAWPEPVARTVMIDATRYALTFGLSPRLPFDEPYRSYLAQLAAQITSALRRIDDANASRAIEAERDSLLMQAPVGAALLTGPTHVFQLANARYRAIAGRDPVGRSFRDAFPELAGTPLARLFDRVYATGEPHTAHEQLIALDRGDGTLEDRYFDFHLEPLRGRDGAARGLIVVAVDLTDKIRALRAKDEFLALLGHELRNPLAPIASALELMKQKDTTTRREQETIERQLAHVIRLVDDLLDLARITRGVIELRRRPLEVAPVVAKAAEIAGGLIEQRGHRLTVDVPSGLHVDADEARLVQILANLLTNAARYTPPGGAITVRGEAACGRVVLRVIDTGIGMEPDLLARVFDLFVQGERGPDRAEGGLGIGLAVVKNLVALHGGTVTATSAGPGAGTEITVSFAACAPAAPGVAAPSARPVTGAGKRVMIVDDNEDAALLLGELVHAMGHETAVLHDPAAALRAIADFAPDVAVLDIGLPGMDGYELAARIRALPARCRLIALTGYGQVGDRARSAAAGFDAHLVKPVTVHALLQLIESDPRPAS